MKHRARRLFRILPAVLRTVLLAAVSAAPLGAEDAGDAENMSLRANVRVYVAPAEGGTALQREYFDFNMPEEVRGSGYRLAASLAESDFYIRLKLDHDYEYGDETITADLYVTDTDTLIITNTMGFTRVEGMDDWNLTLIYG